MQQQFLKNQSSALAAALSIVERKGLTQESGTILFRALVTEVDRIGGLFLDNDTGMPSTIYSIRARLLTGARDDTGRTEETKELLSVFYPFRTINNMLIPEVGEVVIVIYNQISNTDAKIGFWICAESISTNHFVDNLFTKNVIGITDGPELPDLYRYGGKAPIGLTGDYYDMSPNSNYEPFPEMFRRKPGDMVAIGRSNTKIQHSFNAEDGANKSGYIELVTEQTYIKDDHEEHNKFFTDFYSSRKAFNADNTHQWQFLNSSGVRVGLFTKANVDKIFIDRHTEKDGTGQYGNVQLKFDKHFYEPGVKDDSKVGQDDVLQENIKDTVDYAKQADDVTEAESSKRGDILFDDNVASFLVEADLVRIFSRSGDEMNHAVLGERLVRWLIRQELDILYLVRIVDQIRDRLHLLSDDFLHHGHPLTPAQAIQPAGSTKPLRLIMNELQHFNNTDGDVGSDSGELDESGSDSPRTSEGIKDRITEIREQTEKRIKELSEVLSRNIALN